MQPDAANSDSCSPSHGARWTWLTLPWSAPFSPRTAAAFLISRSRVVFVVLFATSLVIYAGVLVFLMLCDETLRSTFGDAWRRWREISYQGWFGPAELTLVLVVLLGTLLVLFLGWLNLPLAHGTGSVWRSYKRSVRASATVLAPTLALTLASGVVFILLELLTGAYGLPFWFEPAAALFIGVAGSLCLLAIWLHRAVRGLAEDAATPPLPPHCEGCGYDLTHRPEEGRCSECGLPLDASLDEQRSRPGSAWSRRQTKRNWWRELRDVLLRPTSFYRRLKLRTTHAAEIRFAARNYVMIVGLAWLWICAIGTWELLREEFFSPFDDILELAFDAIVVLSTVLCGVFGCWLAHRTLAALIVSWWLARRELPDFRWAAKVIAYESAYLWVFCLFWVAIFTSFIYGEMWVSALLGDPNGVFFFFIGMPAEAVLVLCGTFALAMLWLVRYHLAYRAIRWSNF